MQAKNLCFYLSDHGFGHIARNIPLIAEAVRRTNGFVYVVCGKRHLEFAKANLLEILTPEQSSRISLFCSDRPARIISGAATV